MSDTTALIQSIVDGIGEQISDLGPSPKQQVNLDALITELVNLQAMVLGEPDATKAMVATVVAAAQAIQAGFLDGTKGLQDFGPLLGNLDSLVPKLTANVEAQSVASSAVSRITQLLSYRPDVDAILSDLDAIKSLKGGPADATAFHDYHVLQIAFKNIWVHAFDANLRDAASDLYTEMTATYADADITFPDPGTIDDIDSLNQFIRQVRGTIKDGTPQMPQVVTTAFGKILAPVWGQLSDGQRAVAVQEANLLQKLKTQLSAPPKATLDDIQKVITDMVATPEGRGGRLATLLAELGKAMSEPYAFDVFAANTYNFGLLLTYRQEWTPLQYQAGDLRATIPLAPGETRKYTKKTTIKKTRAQKEAEKSVTSSSRQSSDTQRAEADIMDKTDTATNFKMTAQGSFNIGVVGVKATTEFSSHQGSESVANKKDFRESTIKAAQEYRLERSLEVDTTSSFESEETESGEISNPNNEITVTYLFYELQRRYAINQHLYRVRPVILVAQDVPAPHEIDEAWLIEQQWILARVLLDNSLQPALQYLSSGYAGDEASLEILRAQWSGLATVSSTLESQLNSQITVRNYYRDQIANDTLQAGLINAVDKNIGFFGKIAEDSFGDISKMSVDKIEANRKYTESLLQNVNDNIADLQNKLKQSTDNYQVATAKYAEALEKQFSRTVAIDQLRVHVKQNIIYYMQAIWAHEPPDQRFFRLYKRQIANPQPSNDCKIAAAGKKMIGLSKPNSVVFKVGTCKPAIDSTTNLVDLVEVADLDNPLGYKGNYIMFPLKSHFYLTTYMLQEFLDDTYGLKDPDPNGTWKNMGSIDLVAASVEEQLKAMTPGSPDAQALLNRFNDYLNETQGVDNEIIIPTGQLFIEALPGSHPLLEDFKLLHRAEDVRKVKAEVRHAELENLRLASRLAASQVDFKNSRMLEDPDIEKKIIIEGNAVVNAGTD